MECLSSHLHQWNLPFSYCSHFVHNPLSFLHMKLHCILGKNPNSYFQNILGLFGLWLLEQDNPFTKNVCFQNLMIVLENVYVAHMIVNGDLQFCTFKTNSIVLRKFTQIWYCPKGQVFCICRKIFKLSNFTNFNREGTRIALVHCWSMGDEQFLLPYGVISDGFCSNWFKLISAQPPNSQTFNQKKILTSTSSRFLDQIFLLPLIWWSLPRWRTHGGRHKW